MRSLLTLLSCFFVPFLLVGCFGGDTEAPVDTVDSS